MTDQERLADEAKRLLAQMAPYIEAAEKDEYEQMLICKDANTVFEHLATLRAFRKVSAKVQAAGLNVARKAPAVA
jgi:hypothetical protein